MPTYAYACKVCGARFEKFVPFSQDAQLATCPNGHAQVQRIFSPPAIVFKGTGWYKTDSRPANKPSASE